MQRLLRGAEAAAHPMLPLRPPHLRRLPRQSEGQVTMLLFCLTLNVGFTTESAEVENNCLVGKTILNEYSIQLAFTPHLFLILLDLS